MMRSLALREAKFERLMAQIEEQAARVPLEVRADVVSAVYLAAMVKRGRFEIADLVKAEVTKAYGRRHYSLDAPFGDDSGMNWIDTIESDRPHF
jgi:hypothetical protein